MKEIEQDVEEIQENRNVSKEFTSSSKDEVLDEEVVRDFEVDIIKSVKQLPTNVPIEHSEIVGLNKITNLGPGEPTKGQAEVKILQQTSAITEEVVVNESEERSTFTITKQEQKISTTASPLESIQISEVELKDTIADIVPSKPEPTQQIRTDFVPNQSLIITESNTTDTVGDFVSTKSIETKANIEFSVHDAKVISQAIVSHHEEEMETKSQPTKIVATEDILPVEGIEITEVHKAEAEKEFEGTLKTQPALATRSIPESEYMEVTEVFSEDKPSKYYPELVVATEVATKSFVTQKPYVTQETNAPEKEDVYVPGRLPPQQLANISLQSVLPISVTEPAVQDAEKEFSGTFIPESMNVSQEFTTFESITTSVVDTQQSETTLEHTDVDKRTATVDYLEKITVSTSIVNVAESEEKLLTPTETKSLQPNFNYSSMPIPDVSQPFIHEYEDDFVARKRPDAHTGKQIIEPIDTFETLDTYPISSTLPFEGKPEIKGSEASFSYQLQESTEVTTIVSHDKETDFIAKPISESTTAMPIVDTQRSIQVMAPETAEREEIFIAPEMIDSHQATINPTHTLKSIVVEETDVSDSVDKVVTNVPSTTTAKVVSTQMEQMMTSEVTPFEGLTEFKHKEKPEEYTAETALNTQKYIQVTEQMSSEREDNLKVENKSESQTAKAVPSDTFKSIVVEEIQSEMNTDDVKLEKAPSSKAKIVSDEMEETQISETTAFEDVVNIKPTEKPESVVATKSIDLQKSIQVIATESSEREEKFEKEERFDGQIAKQAPSQAFSSLIVEEVEPIQGTSDMNRIEPVTSTAKVRSTEREEMIVSEVQPFDGISDLKYKESPEQFSAAEVLDMRKSIEVTTQIPSEHEQTLETNKFDSHTAKPVNLDTLKSIIVEEVEPSLSTDKVVHTETPQSVAKVLSSEMEEKQITEVVPFEGITQLKEIDKLPDTVATEVLDEMRSIEVSEYKTAEKEDTFNAAKPLVGYNASTIPAHSLKSVQVEEVEPFVSVSDVKPVEKMDSVAKTIIDEQQSSTVIETVTYEGINDIKELTSPDEVTALRSQNIQQSLQVLAQELVEKESKLIEPIPADEQHAETTSSHALKSIVVEETEPSQSTFDFEKSQIPNVTAKIISSNAEETTITETIPFEGLSDMKMPDAIDEKTATRILNEQRSLNVLSNEVSDKEGIFTSMKPQTYQADVAESDVMKSMQVEETKSIDSVAPFEDKLLSTDQAKIVSQDLHEMSISDFITYENTSEFTKLTKPEAKIAQSIQDSQQSIIVECTEPTEQETQLTLKSSKDEHAHPAPGQSYKAAVVLETEVKDSTNEYNIQNISSHAEIKTTEHHQMTTSETTSYESTEESARPQDVPTKTALAVIEERTPIEISSNEAIEKEKEFTTTPEFETQKAKSVEPSALTSAVSQETESSYALDILKHIDSKQELATIKREQLEIANTYQTIPCDTIDSYEQKLGPETKTAHFARDEHTSIQVSATSPLENEENLIPTITETKQATQTSDSIFKSLAIEEVTASDSTRPIEIEIGAKTATSGLVTDQLEETKVTEVIPYESTTQAVTTLMDTKTATQVILTEMKSILTTETEINECESVLRKEDRSLVTANQTIVPIQAPTQEEVQSADTMTPFKHFEESPQHSQVTHTLCESLTTEEVKVGETVEEYMIEELLGTKMAGTEYDEFKALEQTDIKVMETTQNLGTFKPDDKIAQLLQQASDALSVQFVASEIKEEDLQITNVEKKTARKSFSEIEVAQQSEVIPENTVKSIEVKQPLSDEGTESDTVVERKLPVQEMPDVQETIGSLPMLKEKSKKATRNVKKIKVPLTTEITSEASIEPLLQHEPIKEQATEHNVLTLSKTIETTEISVNETTETLDKPISKNKRALQTIDTFKTSTVEVVTSNDTVQTLDIQQMIPEKHSEITQQESMNILQISEVNVNELTDDLSQKPIERQHFAHISETDNIDFAISKQPKVLRGR